jgi:hypothetical protein
MEKFRIELSHDILCISRSDDNRRAAGGRYIVSASRILFIQTNSSADWTARRRGFLFILFILRVLC